MNERTEQDEIRERWKASTETRALNQALSVRMKNAVMLAMEKLRKGQHAEASAAAGAAETYAEIIKELET